MKTEQVNVVSRSLREARIQRDTASRLSINFICDASQEHGHGLGDWLAVRELALIAQKAANNIIYSDACTRSDKRKARAAAAHASKVSRYVDEQIDTARSLLVEMYTDEVALEISIAAEKLKASKARPLAARR
jgi:hypothetical protein